MDFSFQGEERAARAARNQTLFRAVNEQLRTTDPPLEVVGATYVVTCECADLDCIDTLEISREQYARVREDPRRFVVLHGHVYGEVESVVDEDSRFVVVEKAGTAGRIAVAHAGGPLTYAEAQSAMMDPEREAWIRLAGAAAHSAAEQLRKLDDPSADDLLIDLDDFHTRLVEELRAAGLDG